MPPEQPHVPAEQSSNGAAARAAVASSVDCPATAGSFARRLAELLTIFFRIGATSFGGPAVYIAIMEEEFVRRRRWLSPQRFADLVGVTNLIPGPNATEVALHIGYHRAGILGMLAAALAYITPSAVISGLLAWGYVRYGTLPAVAPLLDGIKPAVIAILAGALLRLLPSVLSGPQQWLIAAAVVGAALAGCAEVPTFFVAAVLGALVIFATRGVGKPNDPSPPTPPSRSNEANKLGCWMWWVSSAAGFSSLPGAARAGSVPAVGPKAEGAAEAAAAVAGTSGAAAAATAAAAGTVSAASGVGAVAVVQVWWFFLKIGAVLYGSGYVIAAYIQGELTAPPWNLSTQQVLDALAAGQITPGPFVSTASFVGFLLCGWPGVVVATVAINTPAIILVALTHRWIERCRQWRWTAGALDSVNAAALGLMAAVCLQLGAATLANVPSALVFAVALALSLRWRVGPVWLVAGGAAVGAAFFRQ